MNLLQSHLNKFREKFGTCEACGSAFGEDSQCRARPKSALDPEVQDFLLSCELELIEKIRKFAQDRMAIVGSPSEEMFITDLLQLLDSYKINQK